MEALPNSTTPALHPELLFVDDIITVALTDEQKVQLLPLVRRQAVNHRGLPFCSVAPFWHVEAGDTRLRLQAAFLDHKRAAKVLKIIREANAD